MKISFRHNPEKTVEAIVWCLNQAGPQDMLFVLKWLFYTDKFHLQKYGRPVTGEAYIHLKHGPTPDWAYKALRQKIGDSTQADMIANAFDIYSADKSAKKFMHPKRPANRKCFSVSDMEEMKIAFEFCRRIINDNKTSPDPVFALCLKTHEEKAWKETESRQKLDYELFIDDDTPNREELISHMREVAPWLCL